MQLKAPAIVLAARAHGENAVILRMLTQEAGLVAAYVAGGQGSCAMGCLLHVSASLSGRLYWFCVHRMAVGLRLVSPCEGCL